MGRKNFILSWTFVVNRRRWSRYRAYTDWFFALRARVYGRRPAYRVGNAVLHGKTQHRRPETSGVAGEIPEPRRGARENPTGHHSMARDVDRSAVAATFREWQIARATSGAVDHCRRADGHPFPNLQALPPIGRRDLWPPSLQQLLNTIRAVLARRDITTVIMMIVYRINKPPLCSPNAVLQYARFIDSVEFHANILLCN